SRLLTWEAGDFVLANDRIAVVIEDAGPSDGFDPWGGKVVGMARVEGGRMVEPADFNELIAAIGRFTLETRSVTVMEAGGSSGARIRAIGRLRAVPLIDAAARVLAPGEFSDLEVAIDYRLAPGADYVDVSYSARNLRTFDRRTPQVFFLLQSSRMPRFGPDEGFFLAPDASLPWLGFDDDDATSYAVEFRPDPIGSPLEVSGGAIFIGRRLRMNACAVTSLDYYRLHVGGPGMSGLRASIWRTEGVSTRRLEGVVRDAEGVAAEGVRVHAESADGARYFTRDLTDAEGRYGLDVPADADIRLRAWRRGEGVVGPVSGPDISLPAMGTIAIVATDSSGTPIPVRVQTRPLAGADGDGEPPERFGELKGPPHRMYNVHSADGRATLRVPPGTHRVIVSRGYEYEIFDNDVDVSAGERVELNVALERVVDTTDVMCADFHLHTNRSPDSPDSPELKLRGAAAEGLEIPCRSDHDWITEWDSIAPSLGLGDFLFGVTSLEITSPIMGHFGVVPAREEARVNRGAVQWWDRDASEIFDEVYAMSTDPVLVVNHPRFDGLGYFGFAGYDPLTGSVDKPELWDDRFRVIEVFNESSFDGSTEVVQDWFSFLNRGVHMFAVGSSDSHIIVGKDWEVGYPRTCLRLGVDDAAALRAGGGETLVRDTTRAGAFVVSGGIYVDAVARGGVRPGGELTGVGARESIDVRVQAASWIDVDALEIWVDGVLAETIPIAASTDVVRFEQSLEVTPGRWVVFHAKGDSPLDPVQQGQTPFGVTMPIFMTP
ncbi:MAG: CehA/McbA family metallohydrolase, partial [Deltaproteobacteria bacterium]|nr:CehA/McbA family metallohydrolase [Deltaproteobacteria bacterium]